MDWWTRPWWPDGTLERGAVGGLIVGMLFFVLVCLLRAAVFIRRYGLWCYLKSALKVENESLGLFLILLMLLGVVVLFFRT